MYEYELLGMYNRSNLLLNNFNNANVLVGEICIEREVALLTIMSHIHHNVCKFLIKLYFLYY